MQTKWGIIVGALALGASAPAIMWRSDRGNTRMSPSSTEDLRPIGVLEFAGARTDRGTAVLIGDDIIITAGHQMPTPGTTAQFRIGGRLYGTTGWTINPGFKKAGGDKDLAMGRLTSRVTNVEPADVFAGLLRSNMNVTMAGCGGAGPVGGQLSWNWEPVTGTNVLSSVSNTMLKTTFDKPGKKATEFESQLVPGDSGGGIFVLDGGAWKLAGIAVSRSGAKYGASSSFVRLGGQASWIKATGWGYGRVEVDLNLADYSQELTDRSVKVEILDPATGLVRQLVEGALTSSGGVSFRTNLRGTFSFRLAVDGWLSRKIASVTISDAAMLPLALTLPNGDVDRSGGIDAVDVQRVNFALPSVPSDPNWNPLADVNGDFHVDLTDLSIVQGNLGNFSE